MSLTNGTRLGPYEILAPLGAGGMGEVYRARDTRLGRDVAIKVLPDEVARDAHALARFEQEARAVAALSHPNILALHDVGKEGAVSFVVMELLEGETLREALAKGPLSLRKALDVGLQLAEGLAAAHGKGIVHRDVKPENVFLTKDGHAKLLDFGLARSGPIPTGRDETESPTVDKLTSQGAVLGTVAYMSPEQARGETVDFRSDQFSLGIVLYEMLTGKRPFGGASAAETLAAIIRDEPEPLTKVDPKLPALLGWTVQRCLSKDPEERYSSTRDLVKELQSLGTHLSEAVSATDVAPGEGPRLRRRVPAWVLMAGGAFMVLVGLLIGIRSLRTGSPSASPVRLSISFPLGAAPRFSGDSNPLALSPDGKTLVYAGNKLFVRSLDSDKIQPIAGTEGGGAPFFSPDGRWVGFFAEGKLKKVPLTGGPPITLCDSTDVHLVGSFGQGSWGVDGTIVFVEPGLTGLRRIPSSGGESQALTIVNAGAFESHSFPQILPDGEHVLFEIDKGPDSAPRAAVISLRTGEQRIVGEDAAYPLYLPTGHLVFTRNGSLFAAPFSLHRLALSGPPVPMPEDLLTNRNYSNAAHMAVSSGGTLVYRPRGHFERKFVWVDRRGAVEPLPFPPGQYIEAALSPDGRRLAAIAEEKGETMALLVGDIARATLTRAPVEGILQSPAWAPDGRRIAISFTKTPSYPGKVYFVSADGSGPLEPSTIDTEPLEEFPSSFSPDARFVLLTGLAWQSPHYDIWLLPLSGERRPTPFLHSRFGTSRAVFSSDGRWVAYLSWESERTEVFVTPFPGLGPKWQISADGGGSPRWSLNDRELFYRNGDKMMVVEIETRPTFRAGQPRSLFEGQFRRFCGVDPEGKRFLMIKEDPAESGPAHVNVVLNWFEEVKRRVPGGK